MKRSGYGITKAAQQTGLSDARLTDKQNGLTLTLLRRSPSMLQQSQFLVASDHWAEVATV